jgi:transcriptional regulator with XRE-family HTH domain
MKYRDYVAEREARDPEFRSAREELRPQYEWQRSMIQARIAAGLTQQQLAEKLGKQQAAIARLESGAILPKIDTVYQIATALNATFAVGPGMPLALIGTSGPRRSRPRGSAASGRVEGQKTARGPMATAADAVPSTPKRSGRRSRTGVR